MSNYLGLDVGGTKTYCLVADDTGAVQGFGQAGTGSYEYEGLDRAESENRKAVQAALTEAGLQLNEIHAIGMGIAGADLPEDYEMLEKSIYGPLFGEIPRVFKNDSFAGLRGGTRSTFGVVVACGTGCTAAGIGPNGEEARVGGLGPKFGDSCTGASLGQEGLRAVWRAREGITPQTLLTERFVARGGCKDVDEFFIQMYRGELRDSDLEPMAEVVFDAALDGDPKACDILQCGGRYLGAMANAVARKLALTERAFEVVLAGSVYKGRSPLLVDAMKSVIHEVCPQARLVRPAYEPVVGALIMAYELDRPVSDTLYKQIDRGLAVVERRHRIKLKVN